MNFFDRCGEIVAKLKKNAKESRENELKEIPKKIEAIKLKKALFKEQAEFDKLKRETREKNQPNSFTNPDAIIGKSTLDLGKWGNDEQVKKDTDFVWNIGKDKK